MKKKYYLSMLILAATVLLVGCNKGTGKNETVKIAEPSDTVTTSTSQTEAVVETSSQSNTEATVTESSSSDPRYELAMTKLELPSDKLTDNEQKIIEKRFLEMLDYLNKNGENAMADLPEQNEYFSSRNKLWDFKRDIIKGNLTYKSLDSRKSLTSDVWQTVATFENANGDKSYYVLNYNTFLEKFDVLYMDAIIPIEVLEQ